MSYETEGEKMAQELNEALGIEPNASHTQRLITILRLRAQAVREHETLLELEEATRQRDRAEQRLADVLTAHVDFVSHAVTQAQVLQKITQDFQQEVGARFDFAALDAFDLALAQFREKRDNGERHDLADVEKEFHPDDMRGYNPTYGDSVARDPHAHAGTEEEPLLERLQNGTTDPETSSVLNLGLGSEKNPNQQIPLDGSPFNEEQLAHFREARVSETDTAEHDDAERTPVPFAEPQDIKLADDTRDWMVTLAEGGARGDG